MDLITKYFPQLSSLQLKQYKALFDLYKSWNEKINVVSKKDIDNLYLHHVLHSLAIAKTVQFKEDEVVLDAGTGGGFPGIPLAIMFPKTQFVLVDSIGKKIKVIDAIVKEIKLENVQTKNCRLQDLSGQYDYVVSRAVTRLDTMWNLIQALIKHDKSKVLPNGLLYLKGGNISQELPIGVCVQRWELGQLFKEAYFDEKALVLLYKPIQN